jgi:hypothetical protein
VYGREHVDDAAELPLGAERAPPERRARHAQGIAVVRCAALERERREERDVRMVEHGAPRELAHRAVCYLDAHEQGVEVPVLDCLGGLAARGSLSGQRREREASSDRRKTGDTG